jgi:hypothetical protein
MRTNAETGLKDRFDPRDFYDVVLLSGAVPLDVLKERVDAYIESFPRGSASTSNNSEINTGSSDVIEKVLTFSNWCNHHGLWMMNFLQEAGNNSPNRTCCP